MFLVRGARRRAEERWGEPRLAGACTLPTLLSPSLSLPCSHFGRSASAPCAWRRACWPRRSRAGSGAATGRSTASSRRRRATVAPATPSWCARTGGWARGRRDRAREGAEKGGGGERTRGATPPAGDTAARSLQRGLERTMLDLNRWGGKGGHATVQRAGASLWRRPFFSLTPPPPTRHRGSQAESPRQKGSAQEGRRAAAQEACRARCRPGRRRPPRWRRHGPPHHRAGGRLGLHGGEERREEGGDGGGARPSARARPRPPPSRLPPAPSARAGSRAAFEDRRGAGRGAGAGAAHGVQRGARAEARARPPGPPASWKALAWRHEAVEEARARLQRPPPPISAASTSSSASWRTRTSPRSPPTTT